MRTCPKPQFGTILHDFCMISGQLWGAFTIELAWTKLRSQDGTRCAYPYTRKGTVAGRPQASGYFAAIKLSIIQSASSCVFTYSPGFCPVACQIMDIEFWYQPFPFFRIVFETFAIEANSSSHFGAIFRFRIAINSNLDTNSNYNSSSSWNRTWIQARAIGTVEKRARKAASPGAIGHGDSEPFSNVGSPFFKAIFARVFFSKMVPNGTPNGIKNQRKSQKNETWNDIDKTCWKCVKVDAIGLAKNVFSNGRVATNQ